MQILRDLREAHFQPKYLSLPPAVQEKICLIEVLFERAMLYLGAREGAAAGVPDFDSYLRDLYKNRARSEQKDHEDAGGAAGGGGPYYLGLKIEDWIELLEDSRYYPNPELSHLAMMLFCLWDYWINWPHSRRIFEEENEISQWYLWPTAPAPPSAPSFEATLDRSLVWLAHEVGREMANIRHRAKKKEGIAQRNLERKTKSMAKEVKIVDAFHAVPKMKGDFRNSIVERIYKFLNETIGKKTIERWMEDNVPLMEKYFKKEERGKTYRWVYIGH